MDRIFDSIGAGLQNNLSDDEDLNYQTNVRALIEDARSYDFEYGAPNREENQRYYQGDEPFLDDEGRSTIVATEVKDTVMAILPSLMRMFTACENVVEFIPRKEKDVPMAAQATDYVNYVFWEENEGFLTTHALCKDALIKGTAVVRWWTDNNEHVTYKRYSGITDEQIAAVEVLSPNAQLIEELPGRKKGTWNVVYRETKTEPCHKIRAVPPDTFRIDRNARSIYEADLVGFEDLVPSSELVLMGYDKELVDRHKNSASVVRWNEERYLRNPGLDMAGAGGVSGDGYVVYGEYFIRIDKDGDGVAELRKICTMGDSDEIVRDEVVDRVKMAYFCPDPEPHTVIGNAITDLVKDLQKIKTSILRNSLDSLAQTIWPRLVFNETTTNVDDVLNTETGAPIRTKGNPTDSVQQLAHQWVGEPAYQMMAYFDQMRQTRTGISEASKGVDPKALQSTTVKGVDMIISGAQERIELIARILCETGLKNLFKGLLQEIIENPAPEKTVKLRDEWVEIVPDGYDATMSVRVNPAIGRGSDMDRLQILMQVKATQEAIMQVFGPMNEFVGPVEYRNTISDILAIANIKNVSRYFQPIDPAKLKRMQDSAASKKDPAAMVVEAEIEKIRAGTAKALGDLDFRRSKQEQDEDFRRDKLETDAALKMAEIDSRERQAENVATIREVNNTDRTTMQLQHEAEGDESARAHEADQKQQDRQHTSSEKERDRRHQSLESDIDRSIGATDTKEGREHEVGLAEKANAAKNQV